MKRKNLDDYFAPVKKTKPSIFTPCKDCGESIYSTSSVFHECLPKQPLPKKHQISDLPSAFQRIMSTPQSCIKSNFHLEYLGPSLKPSWAYSFSEPTSYSYKSKPHKLKTSSKDPQEIQLTFTTNHKPSPLHFFDSKPMPSVSPSLLKSLLHKAIRRGLRGPSLKASLQLGCNCG